jgi:UDPglucose--hexose-1-phosphate uridylyltransferase
MKDMGFRRDVTVGRYLDPFDGFKEKESSFEIRKDEITGVTCRILPYRFRLAEKPDVNSYLEKSPEAICPFCPGLFAQMTPKFTPEIIPEGRFQRGRAFLFPNAFPYDRNNAVAIFSDDHFLGLDELLPKVMLDGFMICQDYFSRMYRMDPSLRFCSINWNYMPPAGGGLVHPHLQTIVGENPTRFVKTLYESAIRYKEQEGSNLWRDLVTFEKAEGERFVGTTGTIDWMTSFAPKGMAGEVTFVINEKSSIFSLNDDDFLELMAGLSRIFQYFHANDFISFNMALYATFAEDDYLWIQGRIIPRFQLPPLGTSDLNYFEKFHEEIICPTIPEDLCKEIQKLF